MHKLDDDTLLNTYEDAIKFQLEREFIQLIQFELQKRNIEVMDRNLLFV